MPSIKTYLPIICGSYYHIYNRGINRQNIFFDQRNYYFFLYLMNKYLDTYVRFIAFSLLPNHFHLVIKINDTINSAPDEEKKLSKRISNQFRRMFIAYSLSINNQENRTGSLFDKNYKRIEVNEQEYLQHLIYYVHFNPEKHGIIKDFRKYKFSSYQAYLSNKETKISRKLGFEIFDSKESFIQFHDAVHAEMDGYSLE